MGADFNRLHPNIRERFQLHSGKRTAVYCEGVMEKVWTGKWYAKPFLRFGSKRHVLFPEAGADVPFTLTNYAYRDGAGRETVSWIRAFSFPGVTRRFDDTIVYSERQGALVNYLGTHQNIALALRLTVDKGGLLITTEGQRLYEGPLACRVPAALAPTAQVFEWFDERAGRHRIDARVAHPRFGVLLSYSGHFTVTYRPLNPAHIPPDGKPVREELRE